MNELKPIDGNGRRLSDLAEFVGGHVVGDHDIFISGVGSIETAESDDITFALNDKLMQEAAACAAACIIVPRDLVVGGRSCAIPGACDTPSIPGAPVQSVVGKTLLKVDNPRFAFAKIASLFSPPHRIIAGIHPTSVIAASASLGRDVAIGPKVVVDELARIGDGVTLFPGVFIGRGARIGTATIIHANVTVEHDVVIGNHCIIHSGTVVGSDGFGFVEHGGKHYKVPQIGGVVIGDNVEIGANCTIDRGASGNTIIKSGAKFDNLIHIAHNVVIGHDCLIIAQVGISGSVTVGDNCILAGQVGVAGHLEIGDQTVAAARSGITKSIPGRMHVSGFPAKPHLEEKRIMISLPKLPDIVKKVGQLTTAIQRLARRLDKIEGGKL